MVCWNIPGFFCSLMHWLQRFQYLCQVKKRSLRGFQNYRYGTHSSEWECTCDWLVYLITSNIIVTNSAYVFTLFLHFSFQAENDAIGQELQKQLEAAGLCPVFCFSLKSELLSWFLFYNTWKCKFMLNRKNEFKVRFLEKDVPRHNFHKYKSIFFVQYYAFYRLYSCCNLAKAGMHLCLLYMWFLSKLRFSKIKITSFVLMCIHLLLKMH